VRVNLFGVGTQNESPAITAEKRINCLVETRQDMDRTQFALIGRPGMNLFNEEIGGNPSRGMWAVNSLSQPLLFTVNAGTLYSINNAGVLSVIGAIGTITGDVSMADDGTYLVLVDGTNGWWYNMVTPGALTQIIDGNFTTSPQTVTWQDNYFIVTSGDSRQFQLSQITPSVDPAVWPAIQIGFTGAGAGALQAGQADHSTLHLFAGNYTEFWQNAGSPDFPFAVIPGAAQEFGLASPWSLAKYDNSLTGLFVNKMGGLNVSRMNGFRLQRISDHDIEYLLAGYSPAAIGSATGYSAQFGGHPLYVLNVPDETSHVYNGLSNTWSEFHAPDGGRFWGNKFAIFQGRFLTSDYRNGNIYEFDLESYADNGDEMPMEVQTKHIWHDDKYVGISRVQIDIESGSGLITGQGSQPVMDLQVSKDGGRSFYSVGFSSMGAIGQYTTRVVWNSLGAARDWVLKLRVTDPIHRVITGASGELTNWSF
jgi:hypothetical protein